MSASKKKKTNAPRTKTDSARSAPARSDQAGSASAKAAPGPRATPANGTSVRGVAGHGAGAADRATGKSTGGDAPERDGVGPGPGARKSDSDGGIGGFRQREVAAPPRGNPPALPIPLATFTV